jgi:hypothetical protein
VEEVALRLKHRDEMLVFGGGRSAEETFNVTDWQFLRLRLFVTGGRKTGAQLRVELQEQRADQDEGSM